MAGGGPLESRFMVMGVLGHAQGKGLSPNSTGGLTPFRPLSGLQETPVVTQEESGVLCFPSSESSGWRQGSRAFCREDQWQHVGSGAHHKMEAIFLML